MKISINRIKIYYSLLIIVVAIIFGLGGYCLGSKVNSNKYRTKMVNEKKDYKDAYVKGWSYWFFGYGSHGEGTQYISLYTYGRKYNDIFDNEHDAFIAGYQDGFYYVNHSETDASGAEKGYNQYYPNNNNENKIKTTSSILVTYNDEKNSISGTDISFMDLSTTFLSIIRDTSFRNDFYNNHGKKVDLITNVSIESINDFNSIYRISMICGNLENEKCIQAHDYLDKRLIENVSSLYKYKISILDSPSISR